MNTLSSQFPHVLHLARIAALALVALFVLSAGNAAADERTERIERGRYLVAIGGCGDCHTPMKMGANGPEPDLDHYLAGHPASMTLPAAPALPEGPWVAVFSGSMTAWSGPWGTTFTANLTPDVKTGLGAWTDDDFVALARTGRHMGKGRPVLPPMPIQILAAMTDEDLRAVFAYLQSIPAIENPVPQPLPPAGDKS
jgi:mono/diheme cytochrome c family protein